MSELRIDPNEVTPEGFISMVASAPDDLVVSTIHDVGTQDVLDRVFQGMQQRFLPDRAKDVDAAVQFVITDEGTEHPYVVTIKNETCTAERGRVDSAKVTLTTDLISFLRLLTGQAQGPMLFMQGKLKVAGDLMFAQRIMTFFDRPQA